MNRPRVGTVLAKCGILLALLFFFTASSRAESKSGVVLVRDASAVRGFAFDESNVRAMVANGIKLLTGQTDASTAWRTMFDSNDVVGIKINTQAAPLLATHREVVLAIVDGLHSAGVPAADIWIWDRDLRKMQSAGYALSTSNSPSHEVAVIGNTGWDREKFYESKLVGKLIWGDLNFGDRESEINTRSHLPNIITKRITKLINVPVLQDTDAAGIWGCLYNMSVGAVDNSRRFEQPGRADAAIVQICSMPEVRGKFVLNVMDALIAGFAGGPAFKPQYSWPAASLYFSRDPVAVDALCLELLDQKRRAANVPSLVEIAGHVKLAAQAGLGKAVRADIELTESRGHTE
jgi:hypothetical protein